MLNPADRAVARDGHLDRRRDRATPSRTRDQPVVVDLRAELAKPRAKIDALRIELDVLAVCRRRRPAGCRSSRSGRSAAGCGAHCPAGPPAPGLQPARSATTFAVMFGFAGLVFASDGGDGRLRSLHRFRRRRRRDLLGRVADRLRRVGGRLRNGFGRRRAAIQIGGRRGTLRRRQAVHDSARSGRIRSAARGSAAAVRPAATRCRA